MTVSFGKLRPELQILGCVVALALVVFVAIRLAGNATDGRVHAIPGTTVGRAAAATPVQGAKKPVRYQATQENWRRYRAAAGGSN